MRSNEGGLGFPPVKVSCKLCDTKLVKSQVPPYTWVHEDDYVHLPSMRTDYDHEGDPDVIDVKEAGALPRQEDRSGNSPFDVLRFS